MNTGLRRYPGAPPFETEQRELFFGRNKDIKTVFHLVANEPILVLFGKSGTGKSSLLNAGVIPVLREEIGYQPVQVRFKAWSDSSHITAPIESARHSVEQVGTFGKNFLDQLLPDDHSLWKIVKSLQLSPENPVRILLVFDQFEELFTYPEANLNEFIAQLAELFRGQVPARFREAFEKQMANGQHVLTEAQINQLENRLEVKAVFSIRSDRLSLLDRLKQNIPFILKNTYELGPLDREQAEDAILEPAYLDRKAFATPVFDYSDQAIETMLNYLTKNGVQAIESFQLQVICESIEDTVLEKKLKLVEVEHLGNMDEILERYYDTRINAITPADTKLAVRKLIEEGLIFDEEARRLSLYEGQIYKSYGISPQVLQQLVNSHLLRSEPSLMGGYTYELSHDTLVAPILKAKTIRKTEETAQAEAERLRIQEAQLNALRKEAEQERGRRQKANLLATVAVLGFLVATVLGFLAVQAQNKLKTALKSEETLRKNAVELQMKAENNLKEKNRLEITRLIDEFNTYIKSDYDKKAKETLKTAQDIDSTDERLPALWEILKSKGNL